MDPWGVIPFMLQYVAPFSWWFHLVGGIPTPLKNDGVRQLGWFFQIYGKSLKNHILTMYFNILTIYLWLTKIKFMFQTTNQSWYTWPPAGASHSNPLSSLGHQSSVGGSCIYLSINLFLGKKISICIYIYMYKLSYTIDPIYIYTHNGCSIHMGYVSPICIFYGWYRYT